MNRNTWNKNVFKCAASKAHDTCIMAVWFIWKHRSLPISVMSQYRQMISACWCICRAPAVTGWCDVKSIQTCTPSVSEVGRFRDKVRVTCVWDLTETDWVDFADYETSHICNNKHVQTLLSDTFKLASSAAKYTLCLVVLAIKCTLCLNERELIFRKSHTLNMELRAEVVRWEEQHRLLQRKRIPLTHLDVDCTLVLPRCQLLPQPSAGQGLSTCF